MGHLKVFQMSTVILALIIISLNAVTAQISNPCTTSMVNTITPCANFITGSTNKNGVTPSASCCDSLVSLISTNVDCACLLITANVPLQLPVNTLLAVLSLPQACNVNQMSALCKASGSPLPAPGPSLLGSNGQTLPPIAVSPLSPQVTVEKLTKQKQPRKLQELI